MNKFDITYFQEQYEETASKPVGIDWNKELSMPYNSSFDNRTRMHQLSCKANSWVTCAVGNQCAVIPRTNGEPDDEDLKILGTRFAEAVELMSEELADHDEVGYNLSQKHAINILFAIEKRSTELINEIKNKR